MGTSGSVCQLYYLVDPRTNVPFYVGIGKPGRSKVHVALTRSCNFVKLTDLKRITIMKLMHAGFSNLDIIIGHGMSKTEAQRQEVLHIDRWGRIDLGTGCLTNRTAGGEWINDCPRTDEWKQKISESLKIAQNRPDVKEKKSSKLKGLKRSVVAIENIRKSQLREDVRLRNSESRIGSKNPSARKCVYRGEAFGCVKDIQEKTGLTRYFVKKDPTFSYI